MREPQEIVDEEHEQVIERVAAIDVAKASGMVCVRVPHESKPGRRVSRVWEVAATTRAVIELGDHLVCQGIEKVTVESTSDYWRIWFYLLEAAGLDVQLVSARQARNLPGRPKTDTGRACGAPMGVRSRALAPLRADPGYPVRERAGTGHIGLLPSVAEARIVPRISLDLALLIHAQHDCLLRGG